MAEKLAKRSPASHKDILVIIDAGISTEENLKLLKDKGFNYLCVSRTKLKRLQLST